MLCLPCFQLGTLTLKDVLQLAGICKRASTHGYRRAMFWLLVILTLPVRSVVMDLPTSSFARACNLQPDGTGLSMARALDEMSVPVTMVLDAGVAYCMSRCVLGLQARLTITRVLPCLWRLCFVPALSCPVRVPLTDGVLVGNSHLCAAVLTWCWLGRRALSRTAVSSTSWAHTR